MKDPGDWLPPPGLTKQQCDRCGHWFATQTRAETCPDCLILLRKDRDAPAD
jgi:predicted  nucleic acid-binding Zn-ribbon protein